jgi:proton-dependent oligopeptide transporter, POT family
VVAGVRGRLGALPCFDFALSLLAPGSFLFKFAPLGYSAKNERFMPGSSAAAPLDEVKTSRYRTIPDQTLTRMPPGIPYIIGNEAAERFSFYGMRSILSVFMMTYLLNAAGQLAVMGEDESASWFHYFVAGVYTLPILGSIIADGFLGKYRTILYLSMVYCMGHLSLALNDTRLGLFIGLLLISIGGGGIKPCVSAHLGDQFGRGNAHLLQRAYGWFYISINLGSTVSTFLCPILLANPRFGPHYAFGLPGIFMLLATIVFWMGRKKFVHVPPRGAQLLRELSNKKGWSAIGGLAILYIFVAVFWALWDQSSGGEWTQQAVKLDLNWLGANASPVLASQVQLVNPVLILILVPLFNYCVYPVVSRFFRLTPLRKISIGLFLAAGSFVVIWFIQAQLDAGLKPSIWWQLPAYILLTAGEVMVSITGLEFSYTQAPLTMKSVVMALWLLAVALGNIFVAQLHDKIAWLQSLGFSLKGAAFFEFFTILMFCTAIVFIVFARLYRGKTYIQGDERGQ